MTVRKFLGAIYAVAVVILSVLERKRTPTGGSRYLRRRRKMAARVEQETK